MVPKLGALFDNFQFRILLSIALVLVAFTKPISLDSKRSLELSEAVGRFGTIAVDRVLLEDGIVPYVPPVVPSRSDERFVGLMRHDRAMHGGHVYVGVAPGLGMLSAPLVALVDPIARRAAPHVWQHRWVRHGVLSMLSVLLFMLPVTLATAFVVQRTHEHLFGPGRRATLFTLLYVFGTLSFFNGVSVSAWQIINAFSWLCIYFLFVSPPSLRGFAWLGLAGAAAVTANYYAGLLLPMFAFYVYRLRGARALGVLSLAGALGLLPLAIYHHVAFGRPWATPYGFRVDEGVMQIMDSGIAGFFLPHPRALLELLFSPQWGLLATMPLAVFAFVLPFVRGRSLVGKAPLRLALLGFGLILLFNAARRADYEAATIGGFGSRYLTMGLPFVWLLVLEGSREAHGRWVLLVGAASVFISTCSAMSAPNFVPTVVIRFLLSGPEVPIVGWLHQVVVAFSERRPPQSSVGVLLLLAVAVTLVWRPTAKVLSSLMERSSTSNELPTAEHASDRLDAEPAVRAIEPRDA